MGEKKHHNAINEIKFLTSEITGIPRLIVCHFIVSQVFHFLQIEGKTLQQKYYYDSLCCNTRFISLYLGGLELNLQYLQLMPIITILNVAYSSIFTPLPYYSL